RSSRSRFSFPWEHPRGSPSQSLPLPGRKSGRAPQLVVQGEKRQLEGLDRSGVGNDVVTVLEHLQEVSREWDVARQSLRQNGVDLHQRHRDMEAGPADAANAFQALPELVPAHDVRTP